MYHTSPIISIVKTILNIGTLAVLIQATGWVDTDGIKIRRGEFYELILITLFGMYLMISSGHFLLFFIGLETASLPMAALVSYNKSKEESFEAGAKYLFTAVFSSAVLLMGISFVYGIVGSLYFSDIAGMIAMNNSALLIVALVFFMAGMGFKLSLVPFHLWTADVYQGAPTQVTSYLSVISKGAGAFAFMLILFHAFGIDRGRMAEYPVGYCCCDYNSCQPVRYPPKELEAFPCILFHITGRLYYAGCYGRKRLWYGIVGVLHSGLYFFQSGCLRGYLGYREQDRKSQYG